MVSMCRYMHDWVNKTQRRRLSMFFGRGTSEVTRRYCHNFYFDSFFTWHLKLKHKNFLTVHFLVIYLLLIILFGLRLFSLMLQWERKAPWRRRIFRKWGGETSLHMDIASPKCISASFTNPLHDVIDVHNAEKCIFLEFIQKCSFD